jgi:hypothetical protein
MDKKLRVRCRSPDAFTCHESRAASFPITRQFHRSGSDDSFDRDSAAALGVGDPFILIPNSNIPVHGWLYRPACHDSYSRASLGACRPRDCRRDYTAICFIKEHVVRAANAGLPTGLTVVGRGRSMEVRRQADDLPSSPRLFLPLFAASLD